MLEHLGNLSGFAFKPSFTFVLEHLINMHMLATKHNQHEWQRKKRLAKKKIAGGKVTGQCIVNPLKQIHDGSFTQYDRIK